MTSTNDGRDATDSPIDDLLSREAVADPTPTSDGCVIMTRCTGTRGTTAGSLLATTM